MLRSAKFAFAALGALALTASAAGQSSVFTYQGQLTDDGSPANGSFDMRFELFDAPVAGAQQGGTLCSDNVSVTDGLFTVQIDFGASVFNGADRWLQVGVRADSTVANCGGGGGYTTLSSRQRMTATPYALQSRGITLPFSGNANSAGNAFAVTNSNNGGAGLAGIHSSTAGTTPGVYGETQSTASQAFGVQGVVAPTSPGSSSTAVRGINNGTGDLGIGVWGSQNGSGYGVEGSVSGAGIGVIGFSGTGGMGVAGFGGDIGVNGNGDLRGVDGSASSGTALVYGVEGSVVSTAGNAAGVRGTNSAGSGSNFGVLGEATNTAGGGFSAGVRGLNASTSGSGIGVWGSQNGTGWGGYFTVAGGGIGVNTSAGTGGTGVFASGGTRGVWAFANDSSGLVYGVEGTAGSSTSEAAGVRGVNSSTTSQAYGVLGQITSTAPGGSSAGVRGKNAGTSGLGIGVWGSQNGSGWGVEGSVSGAGIGVIGFGGTGTAVQAVGNFIASGTKSFRIDHPFDPENRYLQHYCTEGPEPTNTYRGTAVTDASGQAWVALPDYFDEINRDAHVQLTVLDEEDFAMVRVARGVADGRFLIKSSRGNVRVFWRVEAVRNDRWVRERGAPVEIEKPEHERGIYLHPELYGFGAERGLEHIQKAPDAGEADEISP